MNIHGLEGYCIARADKPICMKCVGTVYAWDIEEAVKKLSDRYEIISMNEQLRIIDVLPKRGESK